MTKKNTICLSEQKRINSIYYRGQQNLKHASYFSLKQNYGQCKKCGLPLKIGEHGLHVNCRREQYNRRSTELKGEKR